ncbi:hypothetical protein [Methanospirillum purgamenti]|jgi:predicted RNase H-like HicB family nuclease|nr:hypothetical protein [Methanospirillum hungatei]
MNQYKIFVEQNHDCFIAYPVGKKGIIIGQGDTYQEALDDIKIRDSISS